MAQGRRRDNDLRGPIVPRTATAALFTSANPTLEPGELAIESDTGRQKQGDGSTAWTSLAYLTVPIVPAHHDYGGATNELIRVVPSDGFLVDEGASTAGAIKLEIPNVWSNTMMHIRMIGRHHTSVGSSWVLDIGGFTQSSTTVWINTSAHLTGAFDVNLNPRVRFGIQSGEVFILIGDVGDTQNRVEMYIDQVLLGFTGADTNEWRTGWTASMVTTETGMTFSGGDHTDLGYLPLDGGTVGASKTYNWNSAIFDNVGSYRLSGQASSVAMATDDLMTYFDSSSANDALGFADLAEVKSWLGMPRVLAKATEGTLISNSATETDLFNFSVPANTLGIEGTLRVKLTFRVDTLVGTETIRIRFKFGGTVCWDDVSPILGSPSHVCTMEYTIGNTGSTNNQRGGGFFLIHNNAANAAVGGGDLTTNGLLIGTPLNLLALTEDTTAAKAIQVTAQMSGTTNSVIMEYGTLEFLPF